MTFNKVPIKKIGILPFIYLIFFFSIFQNAYSQHNSTNTERSIIGKTAVQSSLNPIPFAHVINKRSGEGKETDEQGYFKMHLMLNDTILFKCLGYQDTTWIISENDIIGDTLNLLTKEKQYELESVDVVWYRSYAAFKYRVAKLEVETNQPMPINMTFSSADLTALASSYAQPGAGVNLLAIPSLMVKGVKQLSKKRDKRQKSEPINPRFEELTGRENIITLTKLEGEVLDDFIVYLRTKHKFDQSASDYKIIASILLAYDNFIAQSTDSIN